MVTTVAKALAWKAVKKTGFRFLMHLGANIFAPGVGSVIVEASILAYKIGSIGYKIYQLIDSIRQIYLTYIDMYKMFNDAE